MVSSSHPIHRNSRVATVLPPEPCSDTRMVPSSRAHLFLYSTLTTLVLALAKQIVRHRCSLICKSSRLIIQSSYISTMVRALAVHRFILPELISYALATIHDGLRRGGKIYDATNTSTPPPKLRVIMLFHHTLPILQSTTTSSNSTTTTSASLMQDGVATAKQSYKTYPL